MRWDVKIEIKLYFIDFFSCFSIQIFKKKKLYRIDFMVSTFTKDSTFSKKIYVTDCLKFIYDAYDCKLMESLSNLRRFSILRAWNPLNIHWTCKNLELC